jgi:hypothetical protein
MVTPATRRKSRSQNRNSTNHFETWTRGELAIADYLLAWALTRIREGWKVETYIDMRKRVRSELEKRDRLLLVRFSQGDRAWPAEHAIRWNRLYMLFWRTLNSDREKR